MRRRHRHIEIARLLDRLPAIDRLRHRKLPRPVLQKACQPVEILPALGARQLCPGRRSLGRSGIRRIHVRFVRQGNLGKLLLIAGADGIEIPLRFRSHEFPADKKTVTVGDLSRRRFRSGIGRPFRREPERSGYLIVCVRLAALSLDFQ